MTEHRGERPTTEGGRIVVKHEIGPKVDAFTIEHHPAPEQANPFHITGIPQADMIAFLEALEGSWSQDLVGLGVLKTIGEKWSSL